MEYTSMRYGRGVAKNKTQKIRISELVAAACQIITDREYAAKVQYDFCNFREVAVTYYDTEMAKLVWSKCDRLIDYHAEKKR